MLKELELDSIIESEDKYNGKKISDVLCGKKSMLFKLIKKGYRFSDTLLKEYGITRTVRDVRYDNVIVEHEKMPELPKFEQPDKTELIVSQQEFEGIETEDAVYQPEVEY